MTLFFTVPLSLLFLAANSVLCKLAFLDNGIDPFSFTTVRLFSGAIILYLLVRIFSKSNIHVDNKINKKSFISAAMLFLYAISFSYSYVLIDTGVGALILFGVVQLSMICYAIFKKQQVGVFKILGAIIAFIGLVYLVSPDSNTNISLKGTLYMALAGLAWAFYSILGKNVNEPLLKTSSNFTYSLVFVIFFGILTFPNIILSEKGFIYAFLSGSITSGIGYVLWYIVVKNIETSTASIIQLIVPILATVGGIVLLDEKLTLQIIIASCIILSGIALCVKSKK